MIKIPFDELTYIEQQTLKTINRECVETDGQSYMKILREPTMSYYIFTGLFKRWAKDYDEIHIKNILYFEDFNNQLEFFNKYKKDIIDEIDSRCLEYSLCEDVLDIITYINNFAKKVYKEGFTITSSDLYNCIYNDMPTSNYYNFSEYSFIIEVLCYWCVKNSLKKLNKFLDKE